MPEHQQQVGEFFLLVSTYPMDPRDAARCPGLPVSLQSVYRTKNLAKFGCRSQAHPYRLLWD